MENSTSSGILIISAPPNSQVSSIKSDHSNVKVALSLGGDSVGNGYPYFNPSSVDSWVSNAVSSLTDIIQKYNLHGIDIDYEHFSADSDTFAECIGQLIKTLKNISFASIASFDDDQVQSHYLALWRSYGNLIDYVNFQFYAYGQGTTVSQFMKYFEEQSNYEGGMVLASFISDGSGGYLQTMASSLPAISSKASNSFMASSSGLQMTPRQKVSAMRSNHKLY